MSRERWPEPQEVIFGALYAELLLRLANAGLVWSRSFAIFASLAGVMVGLAVWCRRDPTPLRWQVRRWALVPAMLISYAEIGHTMRLLEPSRAAWLQSADAVLFGGYPYHWLESLAQAWLTDVLSLAYLLFHPFVVYGLWRHGLKRDRHSAIFFRTLGTLFGIGFLGYTLIPAAGPYLEMAGCFPGSLPGGWLTWFNATLVGWGSNRADCFPSLHCAASGAIWLFEWRRSRAAGWLLAPFVIALWLSTLYLRQHYAVDVLAAALLLAFVYPVMTRYSPGNFGRSK